MSGARVEIYETARHQKPIGWRMTWISPTRANVTFERGIERVEVEFSRANTVVWAARYRHNTLDYAVQPYDRDKRQTVLDWLAAPTRLVSVVPTL